MIENKREWERAEIERSRRDAEHTAASVRLRADERHLERYLDPPLDTAYPLEYAYAVLGDVRSRLVLDLGCGAGENSLLLALRGARVLGVDISEAMLQLAGKRLAINGLADRANFVAASCHDLPLPDASVDVVLGIAILHHLDLPFTAREVRRVLKPGGVAVFQEPVRDSRLIRGVRRLIPYQPQDVSPFERPLTTPELQAFATGFDVLSYRAFTLPFVSLVQVAAPLRKYTHSAYALDRRLLARFPSLTRLSAIRVIALRKPGGSSQRPH